MTAIIALNGLSEFSCVVKTDISNINVRPSVPDQIFFSRPFKMAKKIIWESSSISRLKLIKHIKYQSISTLLTSGKIKLKLPKR